MEKILKASIFALLFGSLTAAPVSTSALVKRPTDWGAIHGDPPAAHQDRRSIPRDEPAVKEYTEQPDGTRVTRRDAHGALMKYAVDLNAGHTHDTRDGIRVNAGNGASSEADPDGTRVTRGENGLELGQDNRESRRSADVPDSGAIADGNPWHG